MTGGVLSSTFIVCVSTVTLPHASVAVHVLVAEYSFGHDPGVITSANVKVGVLQLSVAVGMVHESVPIHSMVVGAGNGVITGGVLSSTINTSTASVVFPHKSVAVHVLVMVYSFGQDPGVVTSTKVKVGVPQLSVAEG